MRHKAHNRANEMAKDPRKDEKMSKKKADGFADLAAAFATRCIEAGVDAKTTSELLGHANVNITLNLYVHPNAEAKRAAVDRMAEAFGGCGEPTNMTA